MWNNENSQTQLVGAKNSTITLKNSLSLSSKVEDLHIV